MESFQRISRLLMETNKTYFAILAHELAKCGITIPQALVLDVIKESPKTIGEISKAIDLSYSTVSGIIDRLERNGIVDRHRDEGDRRMVWVRLAKDLKDLEKKIPFSQDEYYAELFKGMTEEEIHLLTKSLSILQSYLSRKHQSLLDEKGCEK